MESTLSVIIDSIYVVVLHVHCLDVLLLNMYVYASLAMTFSLNQNNGHGGSGEWTGGDGVRITHSLYGQQLSQDHHVERSHLAGVRPCVVMHPKLPARLPHECRPGLTEYTKVTIRKYRIS